ncbi:TRAP transporter small permease subunit [Rubellimicrobium sp. CFH 75288]|uniref:TRAP transporter small permease subunit n=1 Tax=Rubellimicrobium sp. CFH 75288 TaxID=2697034 RepID=UPI0014127A80|nr:TRAP transporter small permease subunit [Rubellimicrobium sp. CFH 75288]NAZ35422.1 TRAP transporter small permease subunit [Rubellimicrobium sp. CFH 75288]
MGALLALSRGIDRVTIALGRIAAVLVLAAALISAGNATSRYLFALSSNAWLEIQWYLFGGIIMLAAAETLRQNGHVRVDLIYSNISERKRLWIDIVGILVFLLPFSIFLAWLCWPVAWGAFQRGEMSSNSGGLIRWPVRTIIALGFTLVAVQGVSELIKRIAALRGTIRLDLSYEKPQQ